MRSFLEWLGVVAFVVFGGLFLLKGYQEVRYYQQLKAEHQRLVDYLETSVAKSSTGQVLNRKELLDGLILQAAKRKQE